MKWMFEIALFLIVAPLQFSRAEILEIAGESCRVERDAYRTFLRDWESRQTFFNSQRRNVNASIKKINEQREGMLAGLLPALNSPPLEGISTFQFEEREDFQKFYRQLLTAWAVPEDPTFDFTVMEILDITPGTESSLIERADDGVGYQLKPSLIAEVRAYQKTNWFSPSNKAIRLAAAIAFFRDKRMNIRRMKWQLDADQKKMDIELARREQEFRDQESICQQREKQEQLAREKKKAAETARLKALQEENEKQAAEQARREEDERLARAKIEAENPRLEGPLTQDQSRPASAHGAPPRGRPVAETARKAQPEGTSSEAEFPRWLTTKGETLFSYLGISDSVGIYRAESGDIISYDPKSPVGKQIVDLAEYRGGDGVFVRAPGCVPRVVDPCAKQHIAVRAGVARMSLRRQDGSYHPWQEFQPSIKYRLLNLNLRVKS